jgi:hypothetical protein
MDLRRALKGRLAGYKIPQEMRVITGELPRNAMGKGMYWLSLRWGWVLIWAVNKKELVREVFGDEMAAA